MTVSQVIALIYRRIYSLFVSEARFTFICRARFDQRSYYDDLKRAQATPELLGGYACTQAFSTCIDIQRMVLPEWVSFIRFL